MNMNVENDILKKREFSLLSRSKEEYGENSETIQKKIKVESEEKMFIQTNKIENDNKEENKKEIEKEKIEKNEKIERIVDPPAKITKKKKGMIKGAVYEITDNYEIKDIIGRGAFGIVFSAYDKDLKSFVAIKKITNVFSDLDEGKRILREIKLLKFFKHKNIINLIDVIKPDSKTGYHDIYLILELMRADLHRLIESPQVFTEAHIKNLLFQILNGVHFLHSADIIHRDLKPNNLLVNQNCDLKIADLGLARKYEDLNNITHYVVTRHYRAPEIILSPAKYTKAIDVWSIGCIFAELMGRTPIFPGKHPIDQLERIIAVLGTPARDDLPYILDEKTYAYIQNKHPFVKKADFHELYPKFDDLSIDLLEKMLNYNPEKRYTALQCLNHPYFNDLKDKRNEIRECQEIFDWAFDNKEYTRNSLQEAIYDESGFAKK